MSLELALADAANNCARQGAKCTLILRSGAQLTGKLSPRSPSDIGTRNMDIDDGWVTVLVDEIAVVHSHR